MYGGLFGDLPAAKGSKNSDDADVDKDKDDTSKSSFKSLQTPGDAKKAKTSGASSSWLLPATKKSHKPQTSSGKDVGVSSTVGSGGSNTSGASTSQQFLKTVGTAGTTMAFVPTAALHKRKRVVPTLTKPMPSSRQRVTSTSDDTVETPTTASASLSQKEAPEELEAIQTTQTSANSNLDDNLSAFQPAVFQPTASSDISDYSKYNPQFDNYITPTEHERDESAQVIEDPYDPSVPNDLLQYWERKALADQRKDLEREAREAIEQQEMIRKELDKERENLLQKGDYEQIILKQQQQQRLGNALGGVGLVGQGRGRGRGVSNLPAWLIEKQRKEQELGKGGGNGESNGDKV